MSTADDISIAVSSQKELTINDKTDGVCISIYQMIKKLGVYFRQNRTQQKEIKQTTFRSQSMVHTWSTFTQ